MSSVATRTGLFIRTGSDLVEIADAGAAVMPRGWDAYFPLRDATQLRRYDNEIVYELTGDLTELTDAQIPGLNGLTQLLLKTDGTGDKRIGGIQGGRAGRELQIYNVGANDDAIILENENGSATAAYRMDLGVDLRIYRRKAASLQYVHPSLRWGEVGGATASFESGVYTPTLTDVANLDASTAYQCQYVRVGEVVTVSGKVAVDPTTTTTQTQLGISLPIASNFGAEEDCGGTAFAKAIAGQGAAIFADAANNRAQMEWIAGDVTNQAMHFTFTYRVIA